jgi:putative membrane protein
MRRPVSRVLRLVAIFSLAFVARGRAQAPVLDDTSILSLLARISTAEVECTTYAAEHASLPATKLLAERLRDDHAAFLLQGAKLAERLRLTIEPQINSAVADSHSAVLADLHVMAGTNVDRAFVDHELMLLQYALDYVNGVMMPAATSAEVKRLLAEARPLLKMHLQLARAAKAEVRKT